MRKRTANKSTTGNASPNPFSCTSLVSTDARLTVVEEPQKRRVAPLFAPHSDSISPRQGCSRQQKPTGLTQGGGYRNFCPSLSQPFRKVSHWRRSPLPSSSSPIWHPAQSLSLAPHLIDQSEAGSATPPPSSVSRCPPTPQLEWLRSRRSSPLRRLVLCALRRLPPPQWTSGASGSTGSLVVESTTMVS
jgi:hypothetical protein